MSYQLKIDKKSRMAACFIGDVRLAIQQALVAEKARSKLTQAELARRMGADRSQINRQLMGGADMTLRSVAEFAYALGLVPEFQLRPPKAQADSGQTFPADSGQMTSADRWLKVAA